MGLSDDLRSELAAIAPRRGCCRLAELSALFHSAGSIHLRGRGAVALHLDLATSAIARRSFSLLRRLSIDSEIRTYNRRAFDRATRYQLHAEERSAQVRPAAARSPDDPPRRPLDRRVPRVEDSGLDECVERAFVAGDVELVARCPVESLPAIGADLGADPELPQERERAPSGGCAGEVEMQGDLAATAKVRTPGRMEERGHLGEPAAAALRRDRRQLVAEILRERHGPRGGGGGA